MPRFKVKCDMYLTIGTKDGKEISKDTRARALLKMEEKINTYSWYDVDGNICAVRCHAKDMKAIEEKDGKD